MLEANKTETTMNFSPIVWVGGPLVATLKIKVVGN